MGEADDRIERARLAREYGLAIGPAHAELDGLNPIWLPGDACEGILAELTAEIEDCARAEADPLVLHLTNGDSPPPVSEIGLARFGELIALAECLHVRLAFENVRRAEHLMAVLDAFPSPAAGLCWDCGHAPLWTPDVDFLSLYGNRLFAVHLNDNDGTADQHLIPFDGALDWDDIAARLVRAGYRGPVSVEAEYSASGRYADTSVEEFLARTYRAGVRLDGMLEKLGSRSG
ncbi:MAG TPA: sugar phosphate isomerase/epimerase family protein [Clostridia bacterium]|nr:sugar phosphate isomerase/epimerase family protein [Clostridia bacterium]